MLLTVNLVQILRKNIVVCKYKIILKIFHEFVCSLLATSSADQTARIWNTDDFTLKQELKVDDQKWVWKTAFTKESERVFTGTYCNCLRKHIRIKNLKYLWVGSTKNKHCKQNIFFCSQPKF